MKKIKVAIVDDHKIIREGIISLFQHDKDIDIVADFGNGNALLKAVATESYDLVLLDMHMPEIDGITTAGKMLEQYPETKILMYTMSEVMEEIEQIVKIGAHGYILKSSGYEELAVAIKVVAHGSSYFSSTVMNSFIRSLANHSHSPLNILTKEQVKILKVLNDEDGSLQATASKMEITETRLASEIERIKQAVNINTDFTFGRFCGMHSIHFATFSL